MRVASGRTAGSCEELRARACARLGLAPLARSKPNSRTRPVLALASPPAQHARALPREVLFAQITSDRRWARPCDIVFICLKSSPTGGVLRGRRVRRTGRRTRSLGQNEDRLGLGRQRVIFMLLASVSRSDRVSCCEKLWAARVRRRSTHAGWASFNSRVPSQPAQDPPSIHRSASLTTDRIASFELQV